VQLNPFIISFLGLFIQSFLLILCGLVEIISPLSSSKGIKRRMMMLSGDDIHRFNAAVNEKIIAAGRSRCSMSATSTTFASIHPQKGSKHASMAQLTMTQIISVLLSFN